MSAEKILLAILAAALGAISWLIKAKFESQNKRIDDTQKLIGNNVDKALRELPEIKKFMFSSVKEINGQFHSLDKDIRKALTEISLENIKFESLSSNDKTTSVLATVDKIEQMSTLVKEKNEEVGKKFDKITFKIDHITTRMSSSEELNKQAIQNVLYNIKRDINKYNSDIRDTITVMEANIKNVMQVMVHVNASQTKIEKHALTNTKKITESEKTVRKILDRLKFIGGVKLK